MLSPVQIHNEIERCLSDLESLVEEIRSASIEQARADNAYKSAFSQSRLKARATALSKVTIDQVEDLANAQTSELRLTSTIATNNLTTLRDVLRATQARLDGLRTLATSHRVAGG
jgi:hypothetical protein